MRDLERRYARLLRLFYPAGYRQGRGAEIVGTYLDLAGPDRRWPSAADVADLASGGFQQRMRATMATDLGPGLRLAGSLALLTATVLATAWSVLELHPPPTDWGPRVGPSVSAGVVIWLAWLVAAVAHLLAPGRWARLAIAVAMLLSAAVVPYAAVTGQERPPLFVLLPQLALGAVAVVGVGRPPMWLRLLPLAAGAAAVQPAVTLMTGRDPFYAGYYGWAANQTPTAVGVALLIVAVVVGMGLAGRGDYRGGWALLVLLGPIGMLCLIPLAGVFDGRTGGAPDHSWHLMAAVAVAVTVTGPALIALALAVRGRPAPDAAVSERCPACGAHRPR